MVAYLTNFHVHMDDGFVETSDVEELAELGKYEKGSSSPHRQNNSSPCELPRKRIKVCLFSFTRRVI